MSSAVNIGILIEQTPEICGGRPRISGTGVSVRRVVGWYRQGLIPEEIVGQIPHLTLAQVHAALAHYHANQEWMDRENAAEDAEADRLERLNSASQRPSYDSTVL